MQHRFFIRSGFLVCVAALVQAGGPAAARGQEVPPLVSDRPDFTESALTVPKGMVQLEMGATYSEVEQEESLALGELLVRVGLVSAAEFRIGLNSYVDTSSPGGDVSGWEDISLGAKVVLAEEHGGVPQAAILVSTTVRTGSAEVGAEHPEVGGVVSLSWGLSPKVGLGTNIGFTRASSEDGRFDQYSWSIALGHDLGGGWGGYLEYYGLSREEPNGPDVHFANGGFTYLISDDLQLDARIGTGMNTASPDWFTGLGLVARW